MSSTERLRQHGEIRAQAPIARPGLAPGPATADVADLLSIRQPPADRFWRGLLLPLPPAGPVSFATATLAWLVGTAVAGVLRGAMRWLWRHTTPLELTAVLGDGELARAARRKLELFPDMHLHLVANRSLSPT